MRKEVKRWLSGAFSCGNPEIDRLAKKVWWGNLFDFDSGHPDPVANPNFDDLGARIYLANLITAQMEWGSRLFARWWPVMTEKTLDKVHIDGRQFVCPPNLR